MVPHGRLEMRENVLTCRQTTLFPGPESRLGQQEESEQVPGLVRQFSVPREQRLRGVRVASFKVEGVLGETKEGVGRW